MSGLAQAGAGMLPCMEKYWSSETISLELSEVRGPVNEAAGSGLEDLVAQIRHKILSVYYNKFHTFSKRDSYSNAESHEGEILHPSVCSGSQAAMLGTIHAPHASTGSGVDRDILATTRLLLTHPWAAAFCPAGFIKASLHEGGSSGSSKANAELHQLGWGSNACFCHCHGKGSDCQGTGRGPEQRPH